MKPITVLVVDDEATLRHCIESELENQECNVTTAGSAEEGLEIAKDLQPDVILLDIVLPGMHGLAALAEFRKVTPETAIVIMTSYSSVETATRAVREGACNYLQKPFEDLDDVWHTVLEAHYKHGRGQGEAPGLDAGNETARRRPKILVVDDEDSIRHVLFSLLDMNDCEVRLAGSAEEAVQVAAEWEPDAALLDIVLPGRSGIKLLSQIKQLHPDVEVMMMTSKASADSAVKAIQLGAYDYLKKPFHLEEVWATVRRALEKRSLSLKNKALRAQQEERRRELSSTVALEESGPSDFDSPHVKEILSDFVSLVCHELNVERATLMLLEAKNKHLRGAVARGIETLEIESVRFPVGQGTAGTVAETARVYASRDTTAPAPDPTADDPSSFLGTEPIALSVPVRSGDETLGVINLGRRRDGGAFATEDVSYLTGMAGQLAATLDGTRRAEQLQSACESLKAAQDQLVHAERIKVVGQMAAGVAHDFNNVLGVILARAQMITASLDQGKLDVETLRRHNDTILKTSLQGAEAIKRIQDYTRIRKDVQREPVDINAAVREAVEIAAPKWKCEREVEGHPIDVMLDLGEVPQVSGNRYELMQVFGNLIFNAVEAMPDGGSLQFRTSFADGRVSVQVTDTGIGMDDETLNRLFEPFFTTKETGQGLGTSILFGIVERHRGEIAVESVPGQGTTFYVNLPQIEVPTETSEEPAVADTEQTSGPVDVFVVDDDELVRETYEEALSLAGHRVVGFDNGADALKAICEHPCDVLITDLSMQGLSGYQVAQTAKQTCPEVKIVLSSGWSVTEDSPEVIEAGIDYVLVKPCSISSLLGIVQKAAQKPVGA